MPVSVFRAFAQKKLLPPRNLIINGELAPTGQWIIADVALEFSVR